MFSLWPPPHVTCHFIQDAQQKESYLRKGKLGEIPFYDFLLLEHGGFQSFVSWFALRKWVTSNSYFSSVII